MKDINDSNYSNFQHESSNAKNLFTNNIIDLFVVNSFFFYFAYVKLFTLLILIQIKNRKSVYKLNTIAMVKKYW